MSQRMIGKIGELTGDEAAARGWNVFDNALHRLNQYVAAITKAGAAHIENSWSIPVRIG